ncbi:MAG: Lrp/AsnC ligand binding domain-containing protein [Chloroflexota bacterium]|uniref:Transcription regulator AsnC/Lrp ligand binding domain-containing protein n=1 Tax=marine metagenome TaxID=408172 RepID=A0A381WJ83_9ZZZZ|nr:Lrp/AsnC ligand binding domain-containing protein [Chloroflexota bacterium]|tara:strand:+ start:1189 stop:1419 length:231 start_codon:yes stop_codon:yes gene_type:complete
MTARAYILIEIQVGKSPDVAAALQALSGVPSVDIITGDFDIIALVEAPDMGSMADLVTGQVQSISGVTRTITCVTA